VYLEARLLSFGDLDLYVLYAEREWKWYERNVIWVLVLFSNPQYGPWFFHDIFFVLFNFYGAVTRIWK
jgi:hypothetical protein